MLPLLVILLLVQSLSATNEFPNLMQNIQVSWNGVDLTSKTDARLTSSLDNQVRYFYLCGPYKTEGKDGNCKVQSYYETPNNAYYVTTHQGSSWAYAHLVAVYDENNFICMRYDNPIPDFMVNKQSKWYVHYNCETVKPESSSVVGYVIGAIIALATIGFFAFKIGQKKGEESSKGISSGAYGASFGGANNTNLAYAGNQAYGNPSYGNPFGTTA